MRRSFPALAVALLLSLPAFLAGRPAYAVTQCGPESDTCQCGANNPFPCCDNGGNCTWWAWESACCGWGVSVPMLGNANTWAGVAANDPNYVVLPNPVPNSIACRASGDYGHVAWVTAVDGSTITVSEMNCWGNYGVRTATYDASYFDGGYIVLKSSMCACTAGASESQNCGNCGQQSRTCGSDCQWGSWGGCSGADPGTACDTGNAGVCATGVLRCVDGNTQCQQSTTESAETCDALDNDCDGTVDEEEVCGDAGGSGGSGGAGGSAGAGGSGGTSTGGSGGTADGGGSGGAGGTWPTTDAGKTDSGSGVVPAAYDPGTAEACACRMRGIRSFDARALWFALLLPLLRRRKVRRGTAP